MNEGHAALAILALLEERHGDPPSSHPDLNALGRLLCAGSDVCFYQDRQRFLGIMRNAIALNGPFFNTQRMVLQYLYDAYLERPDTSPKQRGPVF